MKRDSKDYLKGEELELEIFPLSYFYYKESPVH
jgi:hypothetical protein